MFTPTRPFCQKTNYYPFGVAKASNLLKDYDFQTPAESASDVTKILLLLCGDLMTTLQMMTTEKEKLLNIHLNDLDKLVLARNILIWKIISAHDFNPENKGDMDFLWDIWYNAEWPKTTKKRFQVVLKDLLHENLPENIFIPERSQFAVFVDVWKAWYSICTTSKYESALLLKKVSEERDEQLIQEMWRIAKWDDPKLGTSQSSRMSFWLTSLFKKSFEAMDLSEAMQENMEHEVFIYFKTRSCRIGNKTKIVCINPTFVDPTTHMWRVYSPLSPFRSYFPISNDELDTSDEEGTVIRSCQKILKSLILSYQSRKKTVKIFIHLEDAINFCCAESTEKFDIIETSILADTLGLANIINVCSKRLADTPKAMLFTGSMRIAAVDVMKKPSLEKYVEESLFCPLNMIPTIYGLRLVDHVELGGTNLARLIKPNFTLCWTKAPPPRNFALSYSSTLDRFLELLARRCFDFKSRVDNDLQPGDGCGMLCYTTLTFKNITDSMMERVGGDPWLKSARQSNIPPAFSLAMRTADAWGKGQRVLKLSASSIPDPNDIIRQECFLSTDNLLRLLRKAQPDMQTIFRIVLHPSRVFPVDEWLSESDLLEPNVHCIDNFDIDIVTSPHGSIEDISISFLLLPKSGLEETHVAMVYELIGGFPIFGVFLNSMRSRYIYNSAEEFSSLSESTVPPVEFEEELNMKVESCAETKEQYVIKIRIKSCSNDISDLKVSTDQRRPCESCHTITLTSAVPCSFLKPLILSLPHPVFAEEIPTILEVKNGFVDLALKKAFWEPWPCEFQTNDQFKWIANGLKPWTESENFISFLDMHLKCQTRASLDPDSSDPPVLNGVRRLITFLFMKNACNNGEFLQIQLKGSSSPDWWLRLHKPILKSPLGTPFLLLSAYDMRLADSLEKEGKWKKQAIDEGFLAKTTSIVFTRSLEESLLFRYVLRLNSTRIVPTNWQKDNLSLGENSPWLATYISPLYLDDFDSQILKTCRSLVELKKQPVVVAKICSYGACKKRSPNLKNCARCQSISYCSVKCRQKHWPQHKSSCVKKCV